MERFSTLAVGKILRNIFRSRNNYLSNGEVFLDKGKKMVIVANSSRNNYLSNGEVFNYPSLKGGDS